MKIPGVLLDFLPSLVDFIYPPVCVVCMRFVVHRGEPLCPGCRDAFRRVNAAHPAWRELFLNVNSTGCVGGLLSVYLFEKDGALQQCLHQLKYGGLRSVGARLGEELGASIRSEPVFLSADLLVPVPLHPVRVRERGYNQSEVICTGISRVTGQPVANGILRRVRNTPSQTSLTIGGREKNVRGAFAVRSGREVLVQGKRVILVDDVLTTGATFRSCAGTLMAAGADEVLVASVAIAG